MSSKNRISPKIITRVDDDNADDVVIEGDNINSDDSVIEENINTSVNNSSNFEKTLPPGFAPDGFIIIDESIEDDKNKSQEDYNDQNEEAEDVYDVNDLDVLENIGNSGDVRDKKDGDCDRSVDLDDVKDKEIPDFKVIFKDATIARKYRKKIMDFFKNLVVNRELNDDNDSNDFDLILNFWCSKSNHTHQVDEQLFVIDSKPGKKSHSDIPAYGTKFDQIFKKSCHSLDNGIEENDAAPKLNCFNCLGDHNLRDCKKPRNPILINKNRKEFTARNGPRNVRYHEDDIKFTPGVLSNELRKALGLSHNQLPRHIIKMRYLGYPPGWLEEAKFEHSGLNLYDSDGHREIDPKEEEGELFLPEDHVQYDLKKIYDFPGFNTPAPPGTQEISWDTELEEMHSKEKMLLSMSNKTIQIDYRRKKLIKSSNLKDFAAEASIPMDIENINETLDESNTAIDKYFVPPVPKDTLQPLSLSLSPQSFSTSSINFDDTYNSHILTPKPTDNCDTLQNKSCDSPSLMELVKRKQLLLEELEDFSSLSNPNTSLVNFFDTETSISDKSQCNSKNNTNTSTPKIGSVKCVEYGTPILESTSIYTKLPSSEKFSRDICDVINFENLPGATGKYEKLSGVLNKIKKTLSGKDYD